MKDTFHISGIQQVGIGNPDVKETWAYYRKNFGFDTPVFEEEAEAALMLPYTGGEIQKRSAVLALNMNGGGGLEIWQYTERPLIWPEKDVLAGDLGIHTLKIKTQDVEAAYKDCEKKGLKLLSTIQYRDDKACSFLLKDLHDNVLEIVSSEHWFDQSNGLYGGVAGVSIGVSNLDKAIQFYGKLLGFNKVIWESSGSFEDLDQWSGSSNQYKRVLLERTETYHGPFSPLLGSAQLELIQVEDRVPQNIFENRFWGDPGFIHLCFDVIGMDALKRKSEALNHPFTVDSANSFDMGEAAGRFAYVEDPDGTLIEFVETHKVPILKKIGWYLNLQKRSPLKPLPRWMIKSLGWSRVKD